ncbi:MAG: type II toxin-antitoxin system VapB family antitoxin [Bacteriovoracaceae bacterium]|nr:type II toxin-antitoxin system VapB family antitoxin [Bacteriovoracaceae bacterium]
MRTTLDLREDLIQKAKDMTNIKEKTALVHAALEALIAQEARKRLMALGGTFKKAKAPPRRRSKT